MSARYGIMGSFVTADQLRTAVERAQAAGMREWETFTPYPVDGLNPPAAKSGPRSPVARAMAIAAVCCSTGAFALQEWATHDYPLNVGGRPLSSWPSFIPITFELTVLGTALTGVIAFLVLAGFPRLDHPVFGVPEFRRASQDRFFLLWRTATGQDEEEARSFFEKVEAETVAEVEP
jgi:hypothetical protein